MYELIIVGGGPAGMTAAVYAARKKINALLLAKDIGGQVISTSSIENYMGYQYIEGIELMDKFEQQLKQFPIDRMDGEEAVDITTFDKEFEVTSLSGDRFQSSSVIVATGKKPRLLNVAGEQELTGRGVSYCSVCDGPLFAKENVAIIGGGNSALEAIDDLLKIADRVYSIMEGHFTGDEVLVDRVKDNPKLRVFHGHKVVEIKGESKVEGLIIQDIISGERKQLGIKGIFVEIGLTPNSGLVKGIVRLNQNQEIEVNCNCETNVPGLYAAGDVASTPEKQIIIAAGEGAKAALQASHYLQRLTRM
jgi:alkyl hydroperoxide reductase subunit F